MRGEQESRNLKMETRNSKLETRSSEAEDPFSIFLFPVSIFDFRLPNFGFRFSRWLASIAAIVAAFASGTVAYAQGCALCYNSASALKTAGIRALQQGILILLIPPLAICLGVLYVGYRSRDHYNDPSELEAEEQPGREGMGLPAEESAARSQESGDRSEKEEVRTCG